MLNPLNYCHSGQKRKYINLNGLWPEQKDIIYLDKYGISLIDAIREISCLNWYLITTKVQQEFYSCAVTLFHFERT